MNVTRNVMNDLLPLYFSGEASEDTRTLMEEYFRENPEFERMARGAAKPLETLKVRAWPGLLPSAEREKRDLECVHREMWRRKVVFGLALAFTLAPLAFAYSKGHITWMMVRDQPWDAGLYWGLGAVLWGVYFARLRRRALSLAIAIFFTLLPLFEILQHRFGGGSRLPAEGWPDMIFEATLFWGAAMMGWFQYFVRPRLRTATLAFAIFLTFIPVPFLLYEARGGPRFVNVGELVVVWIMAVFLWTRFFLMRGKAQASSESEC